MSDYYTFHDTSTLHVTSNNILKVKDFINFHIETVETGLFKQDIAGKPIDIRYIDKDVSKMYYTELWYNAVKNTVETIENFYKSSYDTEENTGKTRPYHAFTMFLNNPDDLCNYLSSCLEFVLDYDTDNYASYIRSFNNNEPGYISTDITDIVCEVLDSSDMDIDDAIEFSVYNIYNNSYLAVADIKSLITNDDFEYHYLYNEHTTPRYTKYLWFNRIGISDMKGSPYKDYGRGSQFKDFCNIRFHGIKSIYDL